MRLSLFFAIIFVANISLAEDPQPLTPTEAFEPFSEKVNVSPEAKKANIEKLAPRITGDADDKHILSPWVGYISRVEGKAVIERHDESGENVILILPAKKDHLVRDGDSIDVEKGGNLDITFKNRTKVSLGSRSIFRLIKHDVLDTEQKSIFDVLEGTARLRIYKAKPDTEEKLYTPNAVFIAHGTADIAIRYNEKIKTTSVVCFDGKLSAITLNNSKEQQSYERELKAGKFMEVETSFEASREVYNTTEPQDVSREYKQDVLQSFYENPEDVDVWEYTNISTSFMRFFLGLENAKFKEDSQVYYDVVAGYDPLIHMISIFYMAPYFEASFPSSFDTCFFRTGGRLEAYVFKGLYVGVGGGVFWINKNVSDYGSDLVIDMGYTLAEKAFGFIDGVRASYQSSRASGLHQKSFMLGVVFNLSDGRELSE